MIKDQVSFEDFTKLDLRVGQVVEVHAVELSRNLLELVVDFGKELGKRKMYAGIRKWYTPESLKGRKLIFVVNLAPKKFKIGDREYISEGMMMAAGANEAVLYGFDKDLEPGTLLR